MGKLNVKDKDIVVPGEILAEGMDYLPSGEVFREADNLISSKIGLVDINGRVVKVIPLSGKYIPKKGDLVIGKVTDIGLHGWRVDFGWTYDANISLRDASDHYIESNHDLSRYFKIGDYVIGQIVKVAGPKIIDLSMKGPGLRKLGPGRIIKITSVKVPRVIGKQGSMISLIKESTGCKLSVGQNGLVWISGSDPKQELIAVEAIRMIERQSHMVGLTDKVKEYLEKNK